MHTFPRNPQLSTPPLRFFLNLLFLWSAWVAMKPRPYGRSSCPCLSPTPAILYVSSLPCCFVPSNGVCVFFWKKQTNKNKHVIHGRYVHVDPWSTCLGGGGGGGGRHVPPPPPPPRAPCRLRAWASTGEGKRSGAGSPAAVYVCKGFTGQKKATSVSCVKLVPVNSSALQAVEWCNPSTSCYV